MRRTAAAAFVISAAILIPAPRAQAGVVVNISKSEQRLAVVVDGEEIYRWPVSTGRRGLETPSGHFRPVRFERKWFSRKYDWSPMPFSIFFYKGYAVHGSYETKRLGHAASHGCVRLLPANASVLFNLVRKQGKNDTAIVVMNGPLPAPEPIARPSPKFAPQPTPLPMPPKPKIDPKAGIAAMEPQRDDGVLPHRPAIRVASMHDEAAAAIRLPEAKPDMKADVQHAAIPVVAMPVIAKPVLAKPGIAENHFVAAGDEASVLRGREAWLRSLDRKYGLTR